MGPNNKTQNYSLGFLSLYETLSHDGYLGSILVTDLQGIPQEFRCTHPVKPTTIQKPLYGDALEPYIGVKLCGIPLLKSIQNYPSLIIVHKEFLLDVRKEISCPVIYIRRAGEAIDLSSSDDTKITLKRERIDCPTGRFQPIIFTPHPDFNDDVTVTREFLENIFNYLDPLEPFDRMAKAIEVLSKQDKRFQWLGDKVLLTNLKFFEKAKLNVFSRIFPVKSADILLLDKIEIDLKETSINQVNIPSIPLSQITTDLCPVKSESIELKTVISYAQIITCQNANCLQSLRISIDEQTTGRQLKIRCPTCSQRWKKGTLMKSMNLDPLTPSFELP